ncbi:MAG: YybH family protein [Candidatus Dormibacteraceae bacterium]
MPNQPGPPPAVAPEDLGRFFVERANAGDVEGLVALYEADAVLRFPNGRITRGRDAIRRVYAELLQDRPHFDPGRQQEPLVNGDLALTSTITPVGTTAEVARRQPDGTWRWAVDNPRLAP